MVGMVHSTPWQTPLGGGSCRRLLPAGLCSSHASACLGVSALAVLSIWNILPTLPLLSAWLFAARHSRLSPRLASMGSPLGNPHPALSAALRQPFSQLLSGPAYPRTAPPRPQPSCSAKMCGDEDSAPAAADRHREGGRQAWSPALPCRVTRFIPAR